MSTATKSTTLHGKLLQIVAAIDTVEKRGWNDQQSYAYVLAGDVARAIRNECVRLGVMIIPSFTRLDVGTNAKGTPVQRVQVTMLATDVETGTTITWDAYGDGQDHGDKGVYKAMTGALKYGLRMGFMIPDEDDPEYDEEDDEPDVPQEAPVSRRAERADPVERATLTLATEAKKKALRAKGHAAGLTDPQLKALAHMYVGEKSSKEWTGREADLIISKLDDPNVVDVFRDMAETA